MSWQGAGHASRSGLSSRAAVEGQVQIHIGDKGFDFDAEVDSLRKHVKNIKKIGEAIEQEQKQQGELVNSLEDTMERAREALKRATQRLNVAYRQAKSNHVLFLILFAFGLFFAVYMIARMYRLGRMLVG